MRLIRFLVTNFRSVNDSGWVDADSVTALIGENESGKTNLLLPLWKLNPAREGEILPTADYPKKMFGEIRETPGDYCFITAEFDTEGDAAGLAAAANISQDAASVVTVQRFYDGAYRVSFPRHRPVSEAEPRHIRDLLVSARSRIAALVALKQEAGWKVSLLSTIEGIEVDLDIDTHMTAAELDNLIDRLRSALPDAPAKRSVIVPCVEQAIDSIAQIRAAITAAPPGDDNNVVEAVLAVLPPFVYYSNYGNLDSEIYLPHVVQNLKRQDLGAKEASKTRTLRVLFTFVRLESTEILELGRDFKDATDPNREPTDQEISRIAENKRERSILLQSAGSTLTSKFREWWKQGDYRFRFEADGDHFRIWVSDDRRPEEIELESRSTGLQWFLSFYLVFLVESQGEHREAVLLLDEPGLSLHPLAQRDLSTFFDGLAKTNQILYTTHSPFLVDADHLERARKVYVAADGTTKATDDLRHGASDPRQKGAAYAVYSALNISVAESLLLGCEPILVEGPSDQHYLSAIKSLLIGAGKIAPKRELVFVPSGGTKTARVVASILTGRDEQLPMVLFDDDDPGRRMRKELQSSLYSDAHERVLSTRTYVEFEGSEIEDLMPASFLADVVDRWERSPETPLRDRLRPDEPIVGQIEAWASTQGLVLLGGWKVEVAKRAKEMALAKGLEGIDSEFLERWVRLFEDFLSPSP